MSDNSPRQWLLNTIKPLVPTEWRVLPNQVDPKTIDRVTVLFKFVGLTRLPEAPTGWLLNELVITVLDPHSDHVLAEDALDDDVLQLVTALDSIPQMAWTKAAKVLAFDTYLGWDITAQILTQKEA